MTREELEAGLRQFSGSQEFYRLPLFPWMTYTEGVRWLAANAGCYWLLEEIAVAWRTCPAVNADPMTFWKLRVHPDRTAVLFAVHDTGEPPLYSKAIEFTDFPLDEIDLWLEYQTLMLPDER